MDITFLGGTQTVTGSQHLLSVNGKKILFECGLYQGRRQESYEKNLNFSFDPAEIDACVLTHAHIDHSGNIPNLVKNGFRGPIYATPPTVDLCKIMLRDSGHIQEKDIEWLNKIRLKQKKPPIVPLYTMRDAEAASEQFVGIDYDKSFTVAPGMEVRFLEGGHILGSASIHCYIKNGSTSMRFGYAGDIGRPDKPIIHDPNLPRSLDLLIMESTYGNRFHESPEDTHEKFAGIIRYTAAAGGKLIIPAFAVGRTQELVHTLHKLYNQNRIPDIPIYVDSPLASHATEVFRKHPECFDRETTRIFTRHGEDPFEFPRLKYITEVEDSKRLNNLDYPHIIISASGMAEAGRILHHLRNNIGNHRNVILFVGHAVRETLARKIIDGHREVKIFGEKHVVRAQVKNLDTFSAHADRRGLLDYIKYCPPSKLENIFLVHGELEQAQPLKNALHSKGYKNVHIPKAGEKIYL
ncbi:MAG: MBL fold metallo-hydrolase [Chitinivibrionales bacterium]|nr:MBL fold metallo-hydrolase [Chitinivibrionales bacterium]